MSWWAVKLERNQYQQIKIWNTRYLDQLDYPTQNEFIAAIFRMGLLKKVQVRGWSRSGPQSFNHDPLDQSRVRLSHGIKTCYLGVPTRLSIKNPCLLSQHPSRESIILLFVKGSLSNQCQHVPALPLLPLNFQHSELEKRRWSLSWSVYPFYVIFEDGGSRFESARYFYLNMGEKLVMVKDQSLARSSVVRVWLWSECSGVVTDTLTLFRWF